MQADNTAWYCLCLFVDVFSYHLCYLVLLFMSHLRLENPLNVHGRLRIIPQVCVAR